MKALQASLNTTEINALPLNFCIAQSSSSIQETTLLFRPQSCKIVLHIPLEKLQPKKRWSLFSGSIWHSLQFPSVASPHDSKRSIVDRTPMPLSYTYFLRHFCSYNNICKIMVISLTDANHGREGKRDDKILFLFWIMMKKLFIPETDFIIYIISVTVVKLTCGWRNKII